MNEVFLDTETTGLNPFQGDKIIEIAAIELIDQISTEKKFHCYINPERDIPETSQQIHNISNEMVKNKPIFKDIIDEFLSFIKNDSIKITKLAQGLPVGGEIEQLDDGTLFSAFKNRTPVKKF